MKGHLLLLKKLGTVTATAAAAVSPSAPVDGVIGRPAALMVLVVCCLVVGEHLLTCIQAPLVLRQELQQRQQQQQQQRGAM
jgi:hypothetical protein